MAMEGQQEATGRRMRKQLEAEDEENEEEEEEREIRELEREVSEMAQQILDSRLKIPERLAHTLSSRLLAQRPHVPPPPLLTHQPVTDAEVRAESDLSIEPSLTEVDQQIFEKLRAFRAKTSSNIAAMPIILKRSKDCLARIEKLDQYNVSMHLFSKENGNTK